MTNNEFRNILNDEENLLSKEELDLLINAELAKPEEEMDTKLIDYCLKALQAFNNDDKKERDGEIKTKKKKRVLTRIIAIAAAVAVIKIGRAHV